MSVTTKCYFCGQTIPKKLAVEILLPFGEKAYACIDSPYVHELMNSIIAHCYQCGKIIPKTLSAEMIGGRHFCLKGNELIMHELPECIDNYFKSIGFKKAREFFDKLAKE